LKNLILSFNTISVVILGLEGKPRAHRLPGLVAGVAFLFE
jgi:hypothetical protein